MMTKCTTYFTSNKTTARRLWPCRIFSTLLLQGRKRERAWLSSLLWHDGVSFPSTSFSPFLSGKPDQELKNDETYLSGKAMSSRCGRAIIPFLDSFYNFGRDVSTSWSKNFRIHECVFAVRAHDLRKVHDVVHILLARPFKLHHGRGSEFVVCFLPYVWTSLWKPYRPRWWGVLQEII